MRIFSDHHIITFINMISLSEAAIAAICLTEELVIADAFSQLELLIWIK